MIVGLTAIHVLSFTESLLFQTKKTCILYNGDKITFGHTNGYKIQPGFFASQPESEFQFMVSAVKYSQSLAVL